MARSNVLDLVSMETPPLPENKINAYTAFRKFHATLSQDELHDHTGFTPLDDLDPDLFVGIINCVSACHFVQRRVESINRFDVFLSCLEQFEALKVRVSL
ncbi:hypothetical protein NDU88_005977 [Pleurodeles waltl]|uniref:Uncharacterized protein n=1 Tax=Pleurodeles waltl TaxID=8319 RepID=A0AAV7WE88_PLEWA|nr:hypothetical protein NDU88_005977 [Pleurodeles waltl]